MTPNEAPSPAAHEARRRMSTDGAPSLPVGAEDLALARSHPAPGGAWAAEDWAAYLALKERVPPSLRRWIGVRGRRGATVYDLVGRALGGLVRGGRALRRALRRTPRPAPRIERGPDGVRLVIEGWPIPGNIGTTYGNTVHLKPNPDPPERRRLLLNHEYIHVLQTRRDGLSFIFRYLWSSWRAVRRGEHRYWGNAYEIEAYAVERHLAAHPWLPDVWELPRTGQGSRPST